MKLAILLSVLALTPAAALAQPTPSAEFPPPPSAAATPPGAHGGFAVRLDELRAVLKLRPDQEPALQAYLAELRPDPAMRERMRAERERMEDMTPEQRRDAFAARAPEMQARAERRRDAAQRFLAVLTPEQRTAFDAYRQQRREAGRGMRNGGGAPAPSGV